MNRPPFAEDRGILALYDKARGDCRDGGDCVAAAASRRRIGRQFHRGDGRADAGWSRLSRRRRARQPRAHIVAAPGAARGADGGAAGDAGVGVQCAHAAPPRDGRSSSTTAPCCSTPRSSSAASCRSCWRSTTRCASHRAARQAIVVAASLFFYGWWDVRFVPLLAGLTVANWLIAHWFGCVARQVDPGPRRGAEPRRARACSNTPTSSAAPLTPCSARRSIRGT